MMMSFHGEFCGLLCLLSPYDHPPNNTSLVFVSANSLAGKTNKKENKERGNFFGL